MDPLDDTQNFQTLINMVGKYASHSEIKALLEDAKRLDRDRVRLTAQNKSDLISQNLVHALENGSIPKSKVATLVQDAEENGRQHIFYFIAKSKSATKQYTSAGKVSDALFTKTQIRQFPKFTELPPDYDWYDFRGSGTNNISPNDAWIAKAYGKEEVERTLDPKQVMPNNRFAIVKQVEEERVVLTAVMRKTGILELRISQIDVSGERLVEIYDHFVGMLRTAIDFDDFDEPDFNTIRKNIFKRRHKQTKVYELGNARLKDLANGSAQIVTSGRGDRLSNEPIRVGVVEEYLKEGRILDSLVVFLLKNPKIHGLEEKDVRIVIGALRRTSESNEVFVSAQATRATMDYVTEQLFKFRA